MADQLKQIKDFAALPDFGDQDLLLAQSAGTTYSVKGAALKQYAVDAAKPQADLAAQSAEQAEAAADRAQGAALHPPVVDGPTGCWKLWDSESGDYAVSAHRALGRDGADGQDGTDGRDFTILGYYASLEALQAAVSAPSTGEAYGVGAAAPYDIYVWDAVAARWVNNGSIQGPAGQDGADGQSPYQVAAAGGYAGTEAEFNEQLAQVGDLAAVLDALNGEVV